MAENEKRGMNSLFRLFHDVGADSAIPTEAERKSGAVYLASDGTWKAATGPQGSDGQKGDTGDPGKDAKIVTATATVDATHSESPTCTIAVGGEAGNQTLTFTFTGLQGVAGPKGDTGDAGKDATLPIASASVLGGIKVGSGLQIDGDGVLSVASS